MFNEIDKTAIAPKPDRFKISQNPFNFSLKSLSILFFHKKSMFSRLSQSYLR